MSIPNGKNVYGYAEAYAKLANFGQQHLLKYYDELDEAQRAALLNQIEQIDFSVVSTNKQPEKRGRITPIGVTELAEIRTRGDEFFDAGMAELRAGHVGAVLGELSEGALRVCKQNVRRNSLNARVTCVSVNALEPPASALWDFDIIACNPPYIPTGDIPGLDVSVRDYEPHMALDGGADGLDFYRAVTQKWKSALRLGGSLIFEVGIGQAPSVEDILARNGFEGIQTTADTQGIWRVVEGTVNR